MLHKHFKVKVIKGSKVIVAKGPITKEVGVNIDQILIKITVKVEIQGQDQVIEVKIILIKVKVKVKVRDSNTKVKGSIIQISIIRIKVMKGKM